MGVGMVPYLEIEGCQTAQLLAAQIKSSLGCEVALLDPGQLNQSVTKGFPHRRRYGGEETREELLQPAQFDVLSATSDASRSIDCAQSAHIGHVADKIIQR